MISRPPLRKLTGKFRITRNHVLGKMNLVGHDVEKFVIHPLRIPNHYLAYGLAIALAPIRFRKLTPDLILADTLESSMAAALIKCVFRIPFVFNFIDDYSLIASYEGRMLRYHAFKYLERIIPKVADLVISVDRPKEEFCLDMGIPKEKVRMIPNGVDTRQFTPRSGDARLRDELGLRRNGVVLFVGKMNRYYELGTIVKGIPAVLAERPETQFLFVGDGDDMDHLRGLAKNLKVEDAVVFAGFRPSEQIVEIINLAEICVFSLPDGSALALFEYMACGKPIVVPKGGTRKMGIPKEMIPDNCVLTVDKSPEGFAEGICFLLNNRELALEMGKRARELAEQSYDWNMLVLQYEQAFKEVVKAK